QRAVRAELRAGAAGGAFRAVEGVRAVFEGVRAVWADRAGAAGDALLGAVQQLRRGGEALRVVAPRAVHVAALEKHRGADARPVVYAEALNVKNQAFHCGSSWYVELRRPRMGSGAVGRALDDLALDDRVQRDEARAEAADAHEQVLVILRVRHRVFEVVAPDDAEVRLHAAVFVERLEHGADLIHRAGEELLREADVVDDADVLRIVELRHRVEQSGDAVL